MKKLVLVVKGTDSGETLERWVFDCEATPTPAAAAGPAPTTPTKRSPKKQKTTCGKTDGKSQKEIQNEIQVIPPHPH